MGRLGRLKDTFNRFAHRSQVKEAQAVATQQQQAQAVNKARNEIARCAMALNQLLRPGVTEVIDIKAGKLVIPGQPQPQGGIIVISKSVAFESLSFTAEPAPKAGAKG